MADRELKSHTGRSEISVLNNFIAACRAVFVIALSLSVMAISGDAAESFAFHHENVLGTSCVLRIQAEDMEVAKRAEVAALCEIDRLAGVLSTYDPKSEVSRWQRQTEFTRVSADLWNVLKSSDHWQATTRSAYHPGAEALSQVWKKAELAGQMPNDDAVWGTVIDLKEAPWELKSDTREAKRIASYPLTFNALAKGYIVDQASARALDTKGVHSAVVNIGGDLRVSGSWNHRVSIRSPFAATDSDPPLATIVVKDRAVATSGGYFQGFTIQGRQYSHILDPRSGKPSSRIASSTVVAERATDADAMATAFSVLPPVESLAITRSLKNVECLLVERDGTQHASEGWSKLVAAATLPNHSVDFTGPARKPQPMDQGGSETGWNGGFELKLDFEIAPVDSVRYRRPYVAIWVEDADSYPVNTLVLWVQSTGAGPRWIPDLRRWYRSDRMRRLGEETDLVGTISEATRKPGRYEVVWNGRDSREKYLPPGEYTLLIEAAREHGTYQLIRRKVQFGDQPFRLELPGNPEIKSASVEYRRKEAQK